MNPLYHFTKQSLVKLFMFFYLLFQFTPNLNAQLAKGHSKFFGTTFGDRDSIFLKYWNQATPENASKWESVEGTRNQMNWAELDSIYAFSKKNNIKIKGHTFIWGHQYPKWMDSLSPEEQKKEVEEWMALYAQRYPDIWAIDILNEPTHAPPPFKDAIGGDGETGYDWVIWSFKKARELMPNTKLLINEYGESSYKTRKEYKKIISLLKERGLIDGIGLQCHDFDLQNMNGKQMKIVLDDYATLGLDIYISELDISTSTSNNIVLEEHQLKKYQDLFPVMWEHLAVKGVTLWGYEEGKTWIPDTYLIREDGTERPAMKWLSDYMNSVVKNPVDCTIRARGSSGFEKIRVVIDNKVVKEFNLSVLWKEYSFTGDFGKDIKVEYFNDKKWSTGLLKNVTIDYLKVDDKIYQAEDQEQNTGVYTKFKCGGIKSEKLHCNGYILFKLNEITLSKGTDEPKIRPIETPTKINQNKIERNLLVFPNPSKGIFSIKLDEPKGVMVDIYDFSGKLLDSFNLMNNKEKIVEIKTNLLKGTYLVNVKNQNSKQSSILLVE